MIDGLTATTAANWSNSQFTRADLYRALDRGRELIRKREALDRKVFLCDGRPEELMAALGVTQAPAERFDGLGALNLSRLNGLEVIWSEGLQMTVVGTTEAIRRFTAREIDRFEWCLIKQDRY